MTRLLLAAVILSFFSVSVSYADSSSPNPQPSAAPAASSGKIPYSQLTPDEREIIDNGEISDGSYIAGGIVGTILGLGIGEAIQGRYMPTGLIITLGEVASATLLGVGEATCATTLTTNVFTGQQTTVGNCLGTAGAIGLIGLVGFRIWEIVDVWATPPSINERYRRLKEHVSDLPATAGSFGLVPAFAVSSESGTRDLDGAALAYQIRF